MLITSSNTNASQRTRLARLNDDTIRTDSFSVEPYGVEIFRITQRGTATLLWTSREHAVRYLDHIQAKKLQARFKDL